MEKIKELMELHNVVLFWSNQNTYSSLCTSTTVGNLLSGEIFSLLRTKYPKISFLVAGDSFFVRLHSLVIFISNHVLEVIIR